MTTKISVGGFTKEQVIREINKINEECCQKCKFWNTNEDVFDFDNQNLVEGECMRYPPKQHNFNAKPWELNSGDHYSHPTTIPIDWCGEFILHKGSISIRVSRYQDTE